MNEWNEFFKWLRTQLQVSTYYSLVPLIEVVYDYITFCNIFIYYVIGTDQDEICPEINPKASTSATSDVQELPKG